MCVNDIACAGGEPLFFLDYIACGKNFPEKIASIVSGVAEGCKQSEAALIGGETAEMPGFYPEDEYDLAGFAVGIVDEKDLITGKDIKAGDVLVGIASSGIHSNGYSLVRKVFPMEKEALNEYREELGKTLGEALITPTKIYVRSVKSSKRSWNHNQGMQSYLQVADSTKYSSNASRRCSCCCKERQLRSTSYFPSPCKRRQYCRRNDVQYIQHGYRYDART